MAIESSDPDNKSPEKVLWNWANSQVVESAGWVDSIVSLAKNKKPFLEAQHIANTLYGLVKGDKDRDKFILVNPEHLWMLAYHGFMPPRFKFLPSSEWTFRPQVKEYLKMSAVLLTKKDFVSNPFLMNNFICFFDIPGLWHKTDPFYADFLHWTWGALWTEAENTELAKKIQTWLTRWIQTSEFNRSLLWDDLLNLLYTAYVRLYWHNDITKNHDLFR